MYDKNEAELAPKNNKGKKCLGGMLILKVITSNFTENKNLTGKWHPEFLGQKLIAATTIQKTKVVSIENQIAIFLKLRGIFVNLCIISHFRTPSHHELLKIYKRP